jgi:hypothetical protein
LEQEGKRGSKEADPTKKIILIKTYRVYKIRCSKIDMIKDKNMCRMSFYYLSFLSINLGTRGSKEAEEMEEEKKKYSK